MIMFILTFYLISLIIVRLLTYLKRQKELDKNKEPVIFMDMPDPDNHMLAISLGKRLSSIGSDRINHLHIVAIGHPVNFELSKFDSKSFQFNQRDDDFNQEYKVKMDFRNHVKEQKYEKDIWDKQDSNNLLMANIHTLEQLLVNAGVNLDQVTIYNGGITPRSGLSHAIHDYEEHFMDHQGNILSKEEYDYIVTKIHNLSPSKRKELREIQCCNKIRNISSHIYTLKDFNRIHKDKSTIKWYLAGPATPISSLLTMSNSFMYKNGFIKAMAGAWEGKKNLLGGNFNEQVDWTAFKTIFCNPNGPLFKNATITLLTTETAKQDDWLCYDKEEIQDILGPDIYANQCDCLDNDVDNDSTLKIALLAELWASLKPGDNFQPAFDLALSYDEFDIPFDLHRVKLSVEKDKNAFNGERSKLTLFNLKDYINYFLYKNNIVYAYGY